MMLQQTNDLSDEAKRMIAEIGSVGAVVADTPPSDAITVTTLPKYSIRASMEVGRMLARSGYFADARQASQAVAKILAGAELGIGPVASMTGVWIVKGHVTLSANIYAALIRTSPMYDYRVTEITDQSCSITFVAKPTGEVLGVSTFTIADAKRAGLLAASSAWLAYPRNMLFARALSNGARWFCPDIGTMPLYVPDEMGFLDPEEDDDQKARRKALPAPVLEFSDGTIIGEVVEVPETTESADHPADATI